VIQVIISNQGYSPGDSGFSARHSKEHSQKEVIEMAETYKLPENKAYEWEWSGPDDPMRYSEVLEWLSDRREAFIGSSYYYIRSTGDNYMICRLNISGGSLYSIEVIDHCLYGIADEDIDEAVHSMVEEPEIPDHYSISIHIEKKLRTILDI
jgi:hypothetical protein